MNPIKDKLIHALKRAFDLYCQKNKIKESTAFPPINLSPPKHAEHGDYACNIALALAKPLRRNPRQIAEGIQESLQDADGLVDKSEVAGPGFINLFIKQSVWHDALAVILEQGDKFILSKVGRGKRVLVEYGSTNPTGPVHVAHGRGIALGDVIANLLEAAGFEVTREFYVNDRGHQVDVLARSVHMRYQELFGRSFDKPEEFYPGDYIIQIADKIKQEHGDAFLDAPEDSWLDLFKHQSINLILATIQDDLATFGVHFDNWMSEKALIDRVGPLSIVNCLDQTGWIFEQEAKKWFRSTQAGDDKDRVVVREDGRTTYFASDLSYHNDKFSRGFDMLVNIWGADHGGYVNRMSAGIKAMGYAPERLKIILVQMVSFSQNGQSVRMGKRLGTAVWLRELLDTVGIDAARYFFIMRRADAQFEFDLALATKCSLDNPVFYAQMGHARMCSIARRAKEANIPDPQYAPGCLKPLVLPEEIDLIKAMVRAPEVVAEAAQTYEPHQVVHYIQSMIAEFHSYYTQYKSTERVLSTDPQKTTARLLLCRALQLNLAALLKLLGINAPKKMQAADLLEENED